MFSGRRSSPKSLRKQAGFVMGGVTFPRWFGRRFRVQDLFRRNEPGLHLETYDPNTILRRRNRIIYSDAIANAAWTKAECTAPANVLTPSVNAAQHYVTQNTFAATEQAVIARVRVRLTTAVDKVTLYPGGSGTFANFNLTAQTTTREANVTSNSITDLGGGLFDLTATWSGEGSVSYSLLRIYASSGALGSSATAGDGVSGIEIVRADIRKVRDDDGAHQLVTDWNTEFLAADVERIGMWNDAQGQVPITSVEQTCGMWLDKRKLGRYPRGSQQASANYVTSGGADNVTTVNSATAFTATGGTTVTRTYLDVTGSVGASYEVTFRITSLSGGSVSCILRNATAASGGGGSSVWTTGTFAATGTYRVILRGDSTVPATTAILWISNIASISFAVDSISIKEIVGAGNHATQITAGFRPTLSARVNLFTKSEQFDDTAWSLNATAITRTANTTTAPNGTTTADSWTGDGTLATHYSGQTFSFTATTTYKISFYAKANGVNYVQLFNVGGVGYANFDITAGAGVAGTVAAPFSSPTVTDAGSGWYLCSVTIASPTNANVYICLSDSASATRAPSFTTSAGIYLWGADLRTSNDAALNIPAYQRVNTSTDYDTDDFVHYLVSSNHGFLTPAIDFSAVDKVTVWAGVTKQSDAAAGVVCELTSTIANPNSFAITAPSSAAGNNFVFYSFGTVQRSAAATSLPGPVSAVVTGIGNIAADGCTIRINGAEASSNAGDQGAGNYSNAILYLLRRNDTSVPFVGRITSITVRGSAERTSNRSISRMERLTARLAGKPFASTF